MTIRDFATENNLSLRRDSAGDLIVAGRRTADDMPKQREYANHVYDGFADGGLGVCLSFRSKRKWNATRRRLELAGCLLKQNGDTEGCLTFDPTNAEQVQAVIKAAGLKARRTAPHMLRTLKNMAKRAGVDARICGLHVFRKIFATRLHRPGIDASSIQRLLGHGDLATRLAYLAAEKAQSERMWAVVNPTFGGFQATAIH